MVQKSNSKPTCLFRAIILLQTIVLCSPLSATTTHQWKAGLPDPIRWQKVTPLGYLIAATDKGIYSVDPQKGSVLWKKEDKHFQRLPENSYELVPNTPFVAFSRKGGVSDTIVLNPEDGAVACNPEAAGIQQVVRRHILFETGNVVVFGSEGVTPIIGLFDIATGKARWVRKDLFQEDDAKTPQAVKALQGMLGAALMASEEGVKMANQGIIGDPIEDGADAIIVPLQIGLFKINTKNGDLIWKADLPKQKGMVRQTTETKAQLLKSAREKVFYFLHKNYAMAYSLADGKQLWAKPAVQSGLMDRVIYDPEGLIVCSMEDPVYTGAPRINMLDYKTGEAKWDKRGAKLFGAVTHYRYTDKGLIIAMKSEKGAYAINIIDLNTGEYTLKKPLKIKGELVEMRGCPKGLLYRTTNEFDILDFESGTSVLPATIRAKGKDGRVAVAFRGEEVAFVASSSDGTVQKINLKDGSVSTIIQKLELEGKDTINRAEVRPNGLLFIGAQNVILVDESGKELYRTYYPAPTRSGFEKALLGIKAALDAYDGIAYSMTGAAFSDAAEKMKYDNTAESAMFREGFAKFGEQASTFGSAQMSSAGDAMTKLKQRFGATAASDKYIFMLTTFAPNTYGLVKINKDTGKKDGEIDFGKDREPSYEVDDISGVIYYRQSPTEIISVKI